MAYGPNSGRSVRIGADGTIYVDEPSPAGGARGGGSGGSPGGSGGGNNSSGAGGCVWIILIIAAIGAFYASNAPTPSREVPQVQTQLVKNDQSASDGHRFNYFGISFETPDDIDIEYDCLLNDGSYQYAGRGSGGSYRFTRESKEWNPLSKGNLPSHTVGGHDVTRMETGDNGYCEVFRFNYGGTGYELVIQCPKHETVKKYGDLFINTLEFGHYA